MLQIIAISPIKIKSTMQLLVVYNQAEMLVNLSNVASACATGYVCVLDVVNFKVTVTSLTPSVGSDTIYINITNVIPIVRSPTLTLTLQTSTNYKILSSTTVINPTIPDIITYTLTQSSYILLQSADLYIDYKFTGLSTLNPTINSSLSRLSYMLVKIPSDYTTSLTNNIFNATTNVNSNGTGRITILNVTNPSYTSYQNNGKFYISAFSSTD